jgi:hypothetical protein
MSFYTGLRRVFVHVQVNREGLFNRARLTRFQETLFAFIAVVII